MRFWPRRKPRPTASPPAMPARQSRRLPRSWKGGAQRRRVPPAPEQHCPDGREKQELSTKQEMLDKAFALALEKLEAAAGRGVRRLLAQLAVRASVSGSEQLIFPAADRARYGVKVATKANEILKRPVNPQP